MVRLLTSTGWSHPAQKPITEEQQLEEAQDHIDTVVSEAVESIAKVVEDAEFEIADEEALVELFKSKLRKMVDRRAKSGNKALAHTQIAGGKEPDDYKSGNVSGEGAARKTAVRHNTRRYTSEIEGKHSKLGEYPHTRYKNTKSTKQLIDLAKGKAKSIGLSKKSGARKTGEVKKDDPADIEMRKQAFFNRPK